MSDEQRDGMVYTVQGVERLEAEIDRLRAENEKLRHELDAETDQARKDVVYFDELRAEIERLRKLLSDTNTYYAECIAAREDLRAENGRLRAALKPFADLDRHWEGDKMPLQPKTIMLEPLPVLYAIKALKETE